MKRRIKGAIKRLAGQKPPHHGIVETDVLIRDWDYRPSRADFISIVRRRALLKQLGPAPGWIALKLPCPHPSWVVYFIYAPDGRISDAHRFTIDRLKASRSRVFVIFASLSADLIPPEIIAGADALCWKSLSGFDFSGYAIGLRELATHSPGCRALFMNDSVYGPFCDVDDLWTSAKWDLTGFTASAMIENHIQSYAFILNDITERTVSALKDIFFHRFAFDFYEQVVLCQETQFARVASKSMSVGALWYAPYAISMDPSIYAAVSLANSGFPFLKRSLFTKHADKGDGEAVRGILARHSHP